MPDWTGLFECHGTENLCRLAFIVKGEIGGIYFDDNPLTVLD
jgi:hypothetical protein